MTKLVKVRLLCFLLLLLSSKCLPAADYFWIGGQGDWHTLSNWSLVSGQNQTPTSVPDSNDNVYFDSFSFNTPNPVVSLGSYASCKKLIFDIQSHISPVFQGIQLEANDTVVLTANVTLNLELLLRCTSNPITFSTRGAYVDMVKTNCAGFEVELLDSLNVGRLVLENGVFNAQSKLVYARFIGNGNHSNQSSYNFANSKLFIDTLELIQDVFFTANFRHSVINLQGILKTCAAVDYASIVVPHRAVIGYSDESFCNTAGAAVINIDTILVEQGAKLNVMDHQGQVTKLEIDYMGVLEQSQVVFLRPVEVAYMSLEGQLTVLKNDVVFEFLDMGPTSELILGSTQGQEIRMRLRQDWNIRGTCNNRVRIRSDQLGATARIETTGMLTFDYAQLIDITLAGGGAQDLTHTVVAGNSSGIQITPDPGQIFYWIGDSGDWEEGNNWSFQDGGQPAGCVPGIVDTILFTQNSFLNEGAQVVVKDRTLFMSSLICQDQTKPFNLVSDSLKIYNLGSAIMRNTMRLQGPTELYFYGENQTDSLDISGTQHVLKIEPQQHNKFVIRMDSLFTPQNFVFVEAMDLEVHGAFWQAQSFDFSDVSALVTLQGLELIRLRVSGDTSQFKASNALISVRSECKVLGKPAEISSLRYFGTDTVNINLYTQLDTLFFNLPAHFFTFNDTLPDTTYFTFRATINESGFQGKSSIKGLAAHQAMVIRDVDFNNCEFDNLNLGVANEITLTGNLTINRMISNHSQCHRILYFRKHQDSIAKNCFLISQADSLVLRGMHIYHIDAVGGARFIALDGVDMGNNSGIEFRNRVGRKFYWIGGTGDYHLPDNWSEQSNGNPVFCIPTALDTVIFDSFSFSNMQSDTVFIRLFDKIAVRTWHIEPGITSLPVFYSGAPVTLFVMKDFLQQSDAIWSNPLKVSFLTSRDTSFIDNAIRPEPITLSMNHNGVFNRFMLVDTLRVSQLEVGFGTFISNSYPVYVNKIYAGKTEGFPVGSGNGFLQMPNTYLEVDTFDMYQEEGLVGFLKNRANLNGSNVNTIYYMLACESGQHPRKIVFRDTALGVLIPAQDQMLQGFIDTVIALGRMVIKTMGNTVPYNLLEGNYLETHKPVELLFPLSFSNAILQHDAEFEWSHFYQNLELAPNHTYTFRDQAELKYNLIYAPGSHCEPIHIVSKTESETFTFDRGTGGIFDAQGIRMRDCIAAQAPTYMGPQSLDLGNNSGWVQGRNPNFNLVDLSEDFILCENDSIFISPTTLYQHAKEYKWNLDGQPIDVSPFGFTLSQEGVYTVEVKYTDDCSLFDTARVEIFSRDLLHIGNDTTFCQGGFAVLNADLGSNKSYVWSTGSRRPQINPIRTGLYWVKVTNSSGCTITDSAQVLVVPKPVKPAGTDTIICSNIPYQTGKVFRGYDYLWSTGDTTFAIPVLQSGTYGLVIQNDFCVVEDSVTVLLQQPVRFSIGNDTVLAVGSSLILAADTILNSYLWNTGSSQPFIEVTTEGMYILKTQDSLCESSDTVLVRFVVPPQVRFDKDTFLLCFGDSIDLIPRVNKAGLKYLWSPFSEDSVFRNRSEAGWYSVVVSDSFFSDTAYTLLKVVDDLSFSLGPDTHFCENTLLKLDPNLGAVQYSWNTGDTLPYIWVQTSGRYQLTVRLNNCIYSDSIEVERRALPQVSTFPDTALCVGEVLRYDLSAWPYTLFWNDGSQSFVREWVRSEQVELRVSNRGCDTVLQFSVAFQDPPPFDLGNDTAYCEGDTLILDATRGFAQSYLWNHGPEIPVVGIASPGLYGVTLYDGICEVYDALTVLEEPLPLLDLGSDTTFCYDEPIAFSTSPPSGYTLTWHDGTTSANYLATDTGMVIATLSNSICLVSDTVMVNLCECGQVYIPNALSPNQDGLNDLFLVDLPCNYINFRMQIFNRWGEQVFESQSALEPWDGTRKGKALPAGVYVYRITFDAVRSQNNSIEPVNWVGSVTLVR